MFEAFPYNRDMHDRATMLLVRELLATGTPIGEVVRCTGIPRSTIGNWRRAGFEGVAARDGHADDAACPLREALDRPAYAYLLGQYLGDGDIVRMRNGVYRLQVTCCGAYPGIERECVTAMSRVIPANRVGVYPSIGCSKVTMFSLHWPCLFPQHGPGQKHRRLIRLEQWQEAIALTEHPDQLVRGLIHSDGCRAINRIRIKGREYAYPRYFFSNMSADIRTIFTLCCDELGVTWRRNNNNSISVARRDGVAVLEALVGPKY